MAEDRLRLYRVTGRGYDKGRLTPTAWRVWVIEEDLAAARSLAERVAGHNIGLISHYETIKAVPVALAPVNAEPVMVGYDYKRSGKSWQVGEE